ncbi:Mfa1 family fimbria major subunit [Prevotella copri]|uniref:Mfa1 family fimbria major subunit n=1 Tax=Segatella copri TaxID=165179 RepID=A0AAW4YMZ3_9BACT|nr:Mfa1 family fimbria major subunit [Segatella copri]MCE4123403.1 Mfa1 family fimbria major subunit [Segatella copri]MCP9498403.1 Mfa1 family fimbria major subunit [Segatella copri]MCP9513374.1 Mfa1 family fimbria major subunit [Segatella copri]MCP9523721.1 Mfa1 family fimbria major subunit [Segatella copri]
MKIKHFFGLAVIAAMTASCSSNEDLGTAGSGTGTNEAGVGYASITINLPTTSGTRAVDGSKNDQFDEGTPSEYAVNDATLVIFEKAGASENDYTYVEAVPLGNLDPWKNDKTTGITTESTTITAKLNSATVDKNGGKYYALVILNNETATGTKIILPTAPVTYGKWNVAANTTNITDYKKGFYMANAPEFTTKDVEPTTLVPIKGIYRTKEEAQSKPGTTIHVERGLAKVTVGSSTTEGSKDYFAEGGADATGTNYSSDKVQITKWALDVTNTKSFPVHVTSGLQAGITPTDPTDQKVPAYTEIWSNTAATSGTAPATSRFVSHADAFKRVYWGIDPNYSKNLTDKAACEKEFTLVKANGSDAVWKTSTDPLYCLENTFDISHMMQGQTTRVLLKATYTPKALEKETDKTFFMIGNSSDFWTETTLTKQIENKAKEVLNTTTGVTVTLKGNLLEGGTHVLDATNVEIKEGTEDKTEVVAGQINTKLGLDKDKGIGIKTYKNGESYYIARIKHFGDDLTPWNEGDKTYDGNNLNWLGRYGVLRNNWYDLTINKISGPGYPDVPEVKPTDPDDEDTKYISVSVKILSWAKRSQSVDL